MMRKYQVRFGERSRETRSLRDEKVRSAPTRLSPVLANIYLHELDLFMETLKDEFNQGKKRKKNLNYHRYCQRIARLRKKWDLLKGKEGTEQELQDLQEEIQRIDCLRKQLPSGDPFDEGYKRLFYCRYADDFAIGIIGSYADAESIRQQVATFIQETLKLTIAEEKSHICHSKKGMIFVGYEVRTYSGDRVMKVRRGNRHTAFKAVLKELNCISPKRNSKNSVPRKGMETMRQQKRSTRENGPNRAMPKSSWLTMGNSEVWQTIMLLHSA